MGCANLWCGGTGRHSRESQQRRDDNGGGDGEIPDLREHIAAFLWLSFVRVAGANRRPARRQSSPGSQIDWRILNRPTRIMSSSSRPVNSVTASRSTRSSAGDPEPSAGKHASHHAVSFTSDVTASTRFAPPSRCTRHPPDPPSELCRPSIGWSMGQPGNEHAGRMRRGGKTTAFSSYHRLCRVFAAVFGGAACRRDGTPGSAAATTSSEPPRTDGPNAFDPPTAPKVSVAQDPVYFTNVTEADPNRSPTRQEEGERRPS